MTYQTIRQRLLLSAVSTLMTGLMLAAATSTQASAPAYETANGSASASANTTQPRPTPFQTNFWEALTLEPQDAWTTLRKSFQWQDKILPADAQARVDEWIEHYRSSPENIATITERARPWLAWITQQVSERGLPGEVALIPFVESSFDTGAKSHRGAAGLWQFMPATGDALGLVRNGNYDGRLDVVTSTEAALDYLEMQADQWYEGDLMLSLAAYNAGAGTVNHALRQAQRQGLHGDYWDLSLPYETMQYVPKLKAIATIINDPERYHVTLPEIHTEPAFAKVQLAHAVSLSEASQMLQVRQSALAELNPGLLNGRIDPRSTQTLLVPEEVDSWALAQLAQGNSQAIAQSDSADTYRVESGDSLSTIAARYNIDQQDLIRWNALDRPGYLQPGQLLSISGR
ncbi:hypothetical protein HVA01_07030 [Halovibrio variabilis]|uniref:LysM domain-containing protein n=1 Tax=Halovibrio variabilis TaxID=31910 RepID=A0A511UKD6_9GAMM|nr:transglycosylase SLT domain-containing protein [Halovibrio variabilis]GEN27057.1 hypothetical protein HVA01_07030 [Halovibrio variabilis]